MSDLVDPFGNPVRSKPAFNEGQLIRVLASHRQKLESLHLQSMQLGLFVEYVTNQFIAKLAEVEQQLATLGVEANLAIDMDAFPDWADTRFREIQQEAAQALAEQEGTEVPSRVGPGPLKLDEEG